MTRLTEAPDPLTRRSPTAALSDFFHPVRRLAVEPFLDGDMGHRGRFRRAMPVLLTGREPDDVALVDRLDRAAPSLSAAAAGGHDQRLAQRVRVPRGPCAGLEGHAGADNAC